MAFASNVLKNFALFIEGFGFAGNIEEIKLPDIKIKTEEHRTGGMDAPVDLDMGMEKLETNFTLTDFNSFAISLIGQSIKNPSLTARGAVQDAETGTVSEVVVKMTGKCISYEPDAWKAGEKPKYKFTLNLRYYHLSVDGLPLHVIDIPNMVRIIGGVDQLADVRKAIQFDGNVTSTLRNVFGI